MPSPRRISQPHDERRFLLLANERARRGNALATLRDLLQQPPLSGQQAVVAPFVDDEGIHRGLAQLDRDMIPVAVGGDGTVTSVARMLREAGLSEQPMGVLPLGTGNGLTHSLGIRNLRQAADVLAHGQPVDLDLLTTTHPQAPVSLLSISVGLESLVMADFSSRRSRSLLLGGMLACCHLPKGLSGVSVRADGQSVLEPGEVFCNIGLYNMPCYGFGILPRPAADPADGAADLRLHRSRLPYLAYMSAALIRAASPMAQPPWSRVRHVELSTHLPVQVDGESLAPATFEIDVIPGGLRVLGPSPDADN
jgi:diacylglycerol kinase (ATP)